MSEEVLVDPCPICGQSPLAGNGRRYACPACKSEVERGRWLGLLPHNRFTFRAIGADYGNVETELLGRPFTAAELHNIAGTCYTDADLKAIAAGDLERVHPPTTTIAKLIFGHTHEKCYVQVNNLTRAEGPTLPNGVDSVNGPPDQRALTVLDRGNLFISNQRLVFPSDTHTTIHLDRKLTGVRSFTDAFAVQRKGEEKATYFLGCESRHARLIAAYLQGLLDHLR